MLFIVSILLLILVVNLGVVTLFRLNFKTYNRKWDELPKVSILVAVRNEEQNIDRCLKSLIALDYPVHKLQILVGDDGSNDNTYQIVKKYQNENDIIEVIEIKDTVGEQQGKANVLAHLAHKAIGDFYLITDADMALPTRWVHGMLSCMDSNVGLAIGTTNVQGNEMQDMDWLFALGMVKTVTDLGYPVTGMGNNMIVSKEAYWSVGGYDKIPFSITEDFELFRHIKNQKYLCQHVLVPAVLGTTKPIVGFLNLLNQRKRWMKGALELPLHMVLLLSLQASFYPLLIVTLFLSLKIFLSIFIVKLCIQLFNLTTIRRKLQLNSNVLAMFRYEIYSMIVSVSSIIYFLLPIKIKWKGRTY